MNNCSVINTGGNNGNGIEGLVYFYHPDHLGSSSYITDANGEVSQHLEYFAFGETFVEEHSNKDATPYLYNAKELDEETGLYYYGARYYDPVTSVWQSVDPPALDGRYLDGQVNNGFFNPSNQAVYGYTWQNPIKLTDPDGESPNDWYKNEKTGEIVWLDGNKSFDGYEHLGYHYSETDINNNTTRYDGDTQTKSINGEVQQETFKAKGLANKVVDMGIEAASSVAEGVQITGHVFRAAAIGVKEMINDVQNGGDGTNLRVDIDMPIYQINNRQLVKTDVDQLSTQEFVSKGVSGVSPVVKANTGNAVKNFLVKQATVKSSKKLVENSSSEEN